jgi:hypothetical protein
MRAKWVLRKLQCTSNADHRWEQLVGPGKDPVCPQCSGVGIRPDPVAPTAPTIVDDQLEGGPQFVHNFDHNPIWVETKTQYNELCKRYGMRNVVRHVGVPGSDKSPITTSWLLPSTQDPRPFAFLSHEEQVQRRREAAERLGCSVEELAALADGPHVELPVVEKPRSATEFYPDRGAPAPTKSRFAL